MKNSFVIAGKKLRYEPVRGSFKVKSCPAAYAVTFNRGELFGRVNAYLADNTASVVLIDKTVYRLYGKQLLCPKERIFQAPASESFKTVAGLSQLWRFLAERKFNKAGKLIVIGGGIMQDAGAFASLCYKRGIDWIFVPTTLLSMSDSCIGAKCGINFGSAKNQLGLFSAPREVIIDAQFLATLKTADIKSGLGEILKMAVIAGPRAMEIYDAHIGGALKAAASHDGLAVLKCFTPLVKMSLSAKKTVVEADEFERNVRRSLNYGHTAGHALEVLSGYKIPHGTAIVFGLLAANEISVAAGLLPLETRNEIAQRAKSLLDFGAGRVDAAKLAELVRADKKTAGGKISFVVCSGLGRTQFLSVEINKDFAAKLKKALEGVC
ncbi:MAG: 3-dehydroquinate synthase family protein [Elusimicrobiaceae bacterium]